MKVITGITAIAFSIYLYWISIRYPMDYVEIYPYRIICLIVGIALCAPDFIKWFGKKFQQGVIQANKLESATVECSKCSEMINVGYNFCPHCGNKTDKAE